MGWIKGDHKLLWCWGIRKHLYRTANAATETRYSGSRENGIGVSSSTVYLRSLALSYPSSIIVNHLRRERAEHMKSSIGIAVIYLKYNEPEQTLDNLLASLLKQLAQEYDSIPGALLDVRAPS